jgi:hypothetical protein
LFCGATTGLVPVNVYETPNPFTGTVTVIVPATLHVGCVVTDATGAAGVPGTARIITFDDAAEIHPVVDSVTVKLYVAEAFNPVSVVVAPVPAKAPGLIVHAPEGNPFNTTLPVDKVHVG